MIQRFPSRSRRPLPEHIRTLLGFALLATAGLVLVGFGRHIAGFRPLGAIGTRGLEAVPTETQDRVGPFLASRDTVEIVLERSMTVGDFLDRYRIDFRHVPSQIAAQTHAVPLSDTVILDSGTRLRISLTRPDTASP